MALILSRRDGQAIMVDGCATITVYSKSIVKLHIEAPAETHVLRSELAEKEKLDERGPLLDKFRAAQP